MTESTHLASEEYPRLTPEMIAKARRGMGKERPSRQHWEQVTKEVIRVYTQGLGDDNPLYLDEAYASKSVWGTLLAPPTFIWTTFQSPLFYPSDSEVRSSGGSFPGMQGQFVGAQFEFYQPVKVGDMLRATTTRVGVVDPAERVPGDLLNPKVDIERAIAYGDRLRAAYSGPMPLQIEEHKCYDARTGELKGRLLDNLMRLESASVEPEKGKYKDVRIRKYTDAEIEEIAAQYDQEGKNRRGAQTRCWEDVQVGDTLPPLVKGPLTILSYTAFFNGTGAWFNFTDRILYNFVKRFPEAIKMNPVTNTWAFPEEMHWDPYVAGLLGVPVGFDVGSQRVGWFAHLVTDWMGDDAMLNALDVWFARPMFLYETAWLRGTVTAKEAPAGGQGKIHLELWADAQEGERLSDGSAVVTLKSRQS